MGIARENLFKCAQVQGRTGVLEPSLFQPQAGHYAIFWKCHVVECGIILTRSVERGDRIQVMDTHGPIDRDPSLIFLFDKQTRCNCF